jgi:drug/metabolite transporter (DMT)-like permease
MLLLSVVSLVWAFSFGLIKKLTGLDSTAIAVARLAVSVAVFLPFLRLGAGPRKLLAAAAIGAVQFGLVYIFYLRAYAYLHAYEVALFTITTPIFVVILDAAVARRWSNRFLLAAALSVAGAGILVWRAGGGRGALVGFGLMQLSNACFALGQVAWRSLRASMPAQISDKSVFGAAYAGGLALSGCVSAFSGSWSHFSPTGPQWLIILYLGAVASGVCFFLWNVGATRVNAGVLAVFNNAKVPLGIAVSLAVFGESVDLARLLGGAAAMALGVWVAQPRQRVS